METTPAVIESGQLLGTNKMSKPGQTDYGKGSCDRVSNFKKFEEHFDQIDFGHGRIVWSDDDSELLRLNGPGYYIFYDITYDGPYNTWQSARRNLKNGN